MEEKTLFRRINSLILKGLSVCSVLAVLFIVVGPAYASQTAVVATIASDWTSGAHSVIPVDPVGGPRTAANNLLPTISDITVTAYGRYFYRIEKYNADNVTKFDISAPDTPIWQYSTLDQGATTNNPQNLIFVSPEKAYLLRYGATTAWIVNPSATTEADFKTGELDLSLYDDGDGYPEMHSGVIVGNKLFITLQRLTRATWPDPWTTNTSYLAVFDITTDTEINTTGIPNPVVLGISLPIRNLGAIQYLEANGTIYVQGVGRYGAEYTGGIASVDPGTYATAMVLDDGDDTTHPYGNISGMAIAAPTKGYFIGYAGWGDNTLYSFDPSVVDSPGTAIAGLEHKSIAGMESGVYLDEHDMLWVCNQTDARVDILNTTNNTIDESVSTDLNPQRVVFTTESSSGSGSGTGGSAGGCFITTISNSPHGATQGAVLFSLLFGICLVACFTLSGSRNKERRDASLQSMSKEKMRKAGMRTTF